MKHCPFCDTTQQYRHILNQGAVRVIYPKNPASNYHVLITPKHHTEHLSELTQEVWVDIGKTITQLDTRCKEALPHYIGFNILSNNGDERVNQRVPHCHIHVFLRTDTETGDPIRAPHSKTPFELTEKQIVNMKTLQALFAR